jgi:hypothetical protein
VRLQPPPAQRDVASIPQAPARAGAAGRFHTSIGGQHLLAGLPADRLHEARAATAAWGRRGVNNNHACIRQTYRAL